MVKKFVRCEKLGVIWNSPLTAAVHLVDILFKNIRQGLRVAPRFY